jgi:hypothetical protein
MTVSLHRLLVTLDHVEPVVRRDIVVPSDLRLDRLHQVLQFAMGWEDAHSHHFQSGEGKGAVRYGVPDPEWEDFGMLVLAEARATLAQLAPSVGSRFTYVYDYGDDWWHTVEVVAILKADALSKGDGFHCIAAEGACPPEDCGGPPGYAFLLDVLSDPGNPEHADAVEWVGGRFDPEFVDIRTINAGLARLGASWQPKAKKSAGKAAPSRPAAVRESAASARKPAPPLMLDEDSALAFIETYKAVLLDVVGPAAADESITQRLLDARDLLVREPARLDAAIGHLRGIGTDLDEDVLHALRDIRLQRWIYLRDTRSHSIFLDPSGSAAYGVLGLTQCLRDITSTSGMFVETALLSYRGQIICDALISTVAMLGANLRRECNSLLAKARAEGRYSSERLFPRAVAETGGK